FLTAASLWLLPPLCGDYYSIAAFHPTTLTLLPLYNSRGFLGFAQSNHWYLDTVSISHALWHSITSRAPHSSYPFLATTLRSFLRTPFDFNFASFSCSNSDFTDRPDTLVLSGFWPTSTIWPPGGLN